MHKTTKYLFSLASVIAACALGTGVADAQATPMKIGHYTSQPIGHYEFCQQRPEECRSNGPNVKPDRLTPEKWKTIVRINASVNAMIAPRTDYEMWGREEIWSYPVKYGDCEDYALLKRHELIEAGFNPGNLLMTVVLQPNGDGHAVLTVRTDHGDFILDNLVGAVLDWRDTRYHYLKRQSSANAGKWVDIIDERRNVAQN
ncbi:MAG: transglutaminase-like cysteine peptidase [Oricola sp.]